MSKNEFRYQVHVDAPPERVWATIADFGNVANYNPGVSSSHSTSDEPTGLGATRHCDLTRFGASLEERIVGFEENERLDIDIYDAKRLPGFTGLGATFRVEANGGGTILEGALRYDTTLGPVGAAIGAATRRQNAKAWKAFLAGIKEHVENGTMIEADTPVPVEAVVPA